MPVKLSVSPIKTESKNSSNAITAKNGRSAEVNSQIESTSNRVHKICETPFIYGNRIVSGKEKVSELMEWQLKMVADGEKRKEFTRQCRMIQGSIKKNRYSMIPTELVILLISHEWRRISKSLDRDQMNLLQNMAENVIFSIENSVRGMGQPISVQRKSIEFRTTSSGMRYSLEYANGKGILRLASIQETKRIHSDILQILQGNPGISEIRFSLEATVQTKRILMDIISENRPIIGILRIIPDGRVGTFVIRGIKSANDVLSQQTTDKILFSIRTRITEEIDRKFGTGNTTRITASHNKIIITLPKETQGLLPTQKRDRHNSRASYLRKIRHHQRKRRKIS